MDSPQSCINFSPLLSRQQQDEMFKFPDVSETTTIWDELEDLYKPFYPQTILTSAASSISVPTEVNKNTKKPRKQRPSPPKLSDSASTSDHPAAEKGRKKNQHKRVVQKVTADGLACDKWAWRKYGQKPIKGSPHPRSYYRCSSSKGCLARKQVERSSTDPGVFIVTYSSEHNHSLPTRRSSLAGSTRNKAAASVMAGGAAKNINEPLGLEKEEDREDELVMPDMILSDELFPGLEDLEGLLLNQSPENNISDNSWFIDMNL
uniref:WRKY transcription factor protein 37 n=1 Tax=Zanthoxylum armatum TaxID=67938 RepID=A0A8F1NNQ5_9ROSI|nr:WRKY transcription factor protein 37 [Zanthoxylum armatum]